MSFEALKRNPTSKLQPSILHFSFIVGKSVTIPCADIDSNRPDRPMATHDLQHALKLSKSLQIGNIVRWLLVRGGANA